MSLVLTSTEFFGVVVLNIACSSEAWAKMEGSKTACTKEDRFNAPLVSEFNKSMAKSRMVSIARESLSVVNMRKSE